MPLDLDEKLISFTMCGGAEIAELSSTRAGAFGRTNCSDVRERDGNVWSRCPNEIKNPLHPVESTDWASAQN